MLTGSERSFAEHGRFAVAFLVALTFHAGLLVAVLAPPPTAPPGENEIEIDLAPSMMDVAATAPAEVSESAPSMAEANADSLEPSPEEVAPPETPDPAMSLPTEPAATAALPPPPAVMAPPPPQEQPVPPQPAPPPRAAKPEPKVAMPLPKVATPLPKAAPPLPKAAKPVPKVTAPAPKVAEPKPLARAAAVRSAPAAPSARSGAAAASRENTGGSAASASDPDALSRYAAQLAAALRARLRYPETARAQGITGMATLRFTLHRSGRVISASLARSAGNAVLDGAALATATPGSSLPPAPESVPQQQLTISVPLHFQVR